jgi:hypothetical protein
MAVQRRDGRVTLDDIRKSVRNAYRNSGREA